MTIYQKSYAKTLSGATKDSYIQSKYDTYSHAATAGDSGAASKWRTRKNREELNIHAYTRKLTVLNGSPA